MERRINRKILGELEQESRMGIDITKCETFFGREQFHGLALGMSKKEAEAAYGKPLKESHRDSFGVHVELRESIEGRSFEMECLTFNASFKDDKLTEASLIVSIGDKAAEQAAGKLVSAEAKKRWGKGEEGRGAASRSWEVGGGCLSLVRWKKKTPEDFCGDDVPDTIFSLKLDLSAQ
jgi:hypothetical protein